MELQHVPHFLRHVLDIGFISFRNDDDLDAGAVRSKNFFLETADRQHPAPKRDFAGHRNVLPHRAIRHL